MQNSKAYRRGVVVPLDGEALLALERDDVDESTRVEIVSIATQVEFDTLWKDGLISVINHKLGLCIDDYEQEVVSAEAVHALKAVILDHASITQGVGDRAIARLLALCEVAIAHGAPVYFVL